MSDSGPEQLGVVLSRLQERWVQGDCADCARPFLRPPDHTVALCPACQMKADRREALSGEAARVIQNMERWVPAWLLKAGMSRRELGATWDGIPPKVARVLTHPPLEVRAMGAGRLPPHGFGLSGDAGTGKTFALAVLVRSMLEARWRAWAPEEGLKATRSWLAWVHWPERVNRMRVLSTVDGGLEDVERMISGLCQIEMLVLDDLGAERLRGEYSDDWAASQLDVLVDRRYNDLRPTWFTTNLSGEEFLGRYGARVYSRLCGENAFVSVPAGPDLRIVKPEVKP